MNRRILALAIPSILANITTPLLALVDTAIAGHLGSDKYLAAIAVGGVMFNMLYWFFSFLRAGTSGLSAQAYGAGNSFASILVLKRSMLVAFAAGLLMILLQTPIFRLMVWFLDADAATASLASTYFHLLIFGAPAVLGNYAMSGWFLGMQNSRMMLWVSLIINVVNIATSLLLVYGLDMGITGIAGGTLVAQWTGFGAGFLFMKNYPGRKSGTESAPKVENDHDAADMPHGVNASTAVLHVNSRQSWRELFKWEELKRFFKVNVDIMLRTVCLIMVTLWFTRAGSMQGSLILAVNTLLMQLFILFSYMMDGFAFAGEALVGRYIGAKDYKNMRLCVRRLFMWGAGWALLFTMLYFLGGEGLLGLLSDDINVISTSREYFKWALTVPLAGFAAFAWDGVFIGATMTRGLLLSMFGAMIVFFVTYYLLYPSMGNHALWLAFVLYLLSRGLFQTIIFRFHHFRL